MPSLKPNSPIENARSYLPWWLKVSMWVEQQEGGTRPKPTGYQRLQVEAALLVLKDFTERLEATLQPKTETKDAA